MPLAANRQTRIAIAWDQNPDYSNYEFRPSADYDLEILDPNGQLMTYVWSNSYDNTYEVVDFTPSAAGTYTARIIKTRCDLTPKYMGFAYYQVP